MSAPAIGTSSSVALHRGRVATLGALVGALAGLAVWGGTLDGRAWDGAALVLGAVVVVASCVDGRVALALFAASFLTITNDALRLKIGGLWIPIPALIAGLMGARELIARFSGRAYGVPIGTVPLGILAFGLVTSGFGAERVDFFLAELVKWLAHVGIFIAVAWTVRRYRCGGALLDGLSVVLAVLAAYGLARVAAGESYFVDVFDGVGTRNAAGFYMAALLPIAYARLVDARPTEKLGRLVLFGVLVTGLVFTYTRAAWISALCGVAVAGGYRIRKQVLLIAALLALVWMAPPEIRDRFETIFVVRDYGEDARFASSTVMRWYLIRTGVQTIQENWLWGVGLGNYLLSYHRHVVTGAPLDPYLPHNGYVLLWAEAGVMAFVGVVWFLWTQVRLLWDAWARASGPLRVTLGGLFGSQVAMLTEVMMSNDLDLLIIWTLLGVAAGMAAAVSEREP